MNYGYYLQGSKSGVDAKIEIGGRIGTTFKVVGVNIFGGTPVIIGAITLKAGYQLCDTSTSVALRDNLTGDFTATVTGGLRWETPAVVFLGYGSKAFAEFGAYGSWMYHFETYLGEGGFGVY